ncbi:tetratricopeptide repeat protein, partial [Bacteroidota bacterium]
MKKWISFLVALVIIIIAFLLIKPKISNNYYQKGQHSADSLEYDIAAEYFSKSIKFNKKNIKAILGRANAFYQLEELENAEADFNYLLQLDNQNYEAYFGRALIFIKNSSWESALSDLNKAKELKSDSPEIFYFI